MQIVKKLRTKIRRTDGEKEVDFIVEKRATYYAFRAFEIGSTSNIPYAIHTGTQRYIAQIWKRYTKEKF